MLKVIDLVYYSHNDCKDPQVVLNIHAPANGFAGFIKDRINIQFVKHMNYEGSETINGIKYSFFKSHNRFWYVPFRTHRYIKSQRPDIVLVEGLIFPLQLIMLKYLLGKKAKIIVQHHNEKPFPGIKRFLQSLASRCIDIYLFTAKDDATEWINQKIITDKSKCREVLEASTYLQKQDKIESQRKVGMTGSYNFLWVGRLDTVKDPFTVLKSFEKLIDVNPAAKLYMIYQSGSIIDAVKNIIEQTPNLKNAVQLIGKIDHKELAYWYSAANFYISGSLREGSSYALLEAMHCGCIPIITNISSFNKMTMSGKYAFLFPPGNADQLLSVMQTVQSIDINEFSEKVSSFAKNNLGFKNIADDIFSVCAELVPVKR